MTFGVFQKDCWLSVCVNKPHLSALLGLVALTWELSFESHSSLLQTVSLCQWPSDMVFGIRKVAGVTRAEEMKMWSLLCHHRICTWGCGVCMCGALAPIQGHQSWPNFSLYQDDLRSTMHFSSVVIAKEIVLRVKCFIPRKWNRLSLWLLGLEPSQSLWPVLVSSPPFGT